MTLTFLSCIKDLVLWLDTTLFFLFYLGVLFLLTFPSDNG